MSALLEVQDAPQIEGWVRQRDRHGLGTVYVAHLAADFYKIGYTKRPVGQRLANLRSSHCGPFSLVHAIRAVDAYALEQELHSMLLPFRCLCFWEGEGKRESCAARGYRFRMGETYHLPDHILDLLKGFRFCGTVDPDESAVVRAMARVTNPLHDQIIAEWKAEHPWDGRKRRRRTTPTAPREEP